MEFESVSELKESPTLPPRLTNLTVGYSQDYGERTWHLFGKEGTTFVSVEAPSAALGAGLIERTVDFAKRHHYWPRRLTGWPVWVAILTNSVLSFYGAFSGTVDRLPLILGLSVLIAQGCLLYVGLARDRLFPAFALTLRKQETSLSKNAPLIALVASVVSAIAALLQLLIPR